MCLVHKVRQLASIAASILGIALFFIDLKPGKNNGNYNMQGVGEEPAQSPLRARSEQDHSSLGDEVLRRVLMKHHPPALSRNPFAKFFGSMARECQLLFQDLELECALVRTREEDDILGSAYQVACKPIVLEVVAGRDDHNLIVPCTLAAVYH
jgi:hypothetical protein